MKKRYTKKLPEYDEIEFDEEAVLEMTKTFRKQRKVPTSIALEPETISQLKKVAEKNQVPYQALMRSLIIDGLKRLIKKKAA